MIPKMIATMMLSSLISFAATAQNKQDAAVGAAVEALRQAMISGEKAALEKIAAADLSYGHSSGKVEDKAAFVEAISSGKSDFVTIDLTEQTIKVTGNTAIVRHKLSATTNDGGNPGSVKLSILLVWQNQKGQWLLLARQAVKVP